MTQSVQLKASIREACGYLCRSWEENDAFLGFKIDGPGVSDEWVTAYVGRCLLCARSHLTKAEILILKKAVEFLKRKMRPSGGWGFNGACGEDCDSTAHVILFLDEMGEMPEEKSLDCLRGFQREDGGFSTYSGGTKASWEISHVDVTACALLGLSREGRIAASDLHRAVTYLGRWFHAFDLPPAYWWESEYYTSLLACDCFRKWRLPFPDQRILQVCQEKEMPETRFDKALLLELLVKLSGEKKRADAIVNALLMEQQKDGSFQGGEILRVTRSDCLEPWIKGSYDLIFDGNVFTTAAVIRALCCYFETLGRGEGK